MAMTKQTNDGKMRRVAEGVYIRNGTYIVPIWNPQKGSRGGKDFHRLGDCPCGVFHPGSTLTHAKALKRKLEDKKASGRQRRNGGEGPLTVADWAGYYTTGSEPEKWMPGRWLKKFPRDAETTNVHNDERSRAFARRFAGRTMESIIEEEAQDFALEHPSSFKVLRSMFNDAMRLHLVEGNPFAGLSVPASKGRKDIVVLTDAELAQLSGIARVVHGPYGPLFAAMIEVAAWTGLRPGELFLLALEPADRPEDRVNFVDLKAGIVNVDWQRAKTGKITRPKHESQRKVVLLPAAEAALRSIAHLGARQGPVFRTRRSSVFAPRSHFYYWDPVRSAFVVSLPAGHHLRQRTAATGGGENLDFYELRHYFGTKLAHPPAGITPASPYEIAEMMGHKDGGKLAMERYIHAPAQEAQNSIRNAWRRAS